MSKIRKYKFSYSELDINREELYRLIGFDQDELPEPFLSYLVDAETTANKDADYEGAFLITDDFSIHSDKKELTIHNEIFRPGKIILNQIRNADQLAIFVCTAGHALSEQAQMEMNEGDSVAGYILDLLGSLSVEAALDKMQNNLEEIFSPEDASISNRFSPGYCGWDVAEQKKLFSILPSGFTTVSLNDTALMHPIKSVSGIIGIGSDMKRKPYSCSFCNDTNCLYRKLKNVNQL